MPGLIVRPLLVHILVDPGRAPHHLTLASIDADVGADRVHHVDARDLAKLPGPRFEAVGLGDERADRAEIDDVAGQLEVTAPSR
jgi:hypothetical protein